MVHDGESSFGQWWLQSERPDAAAYSIAAARLDAVPLFPLPGIVLFPHALLPLHIFESRYRIMTADALAGDRLIAMALIRAAPPRPTGSSSDIHPVVCVGRIVRHERLADGRYNLLLQGLTRARVDSERRVGHSEAQKQYRIARLLPMVDAGGMDIDLELQRAGLRGVLASHSRLSGSAETLSKLIDGPAATAKIADLMAFHLLDDVRVQQAVLGDRNVRRRIQRLIAHLETGDQTRAFSSAAAMN